MPGIMNSGWAGWKREVKNDAGGEKIAFHVLLEFRCGGLNEVSSISLPALE